MICDSLSKGYIDQFLFIFHPLYSTFQLHKKFEAYLFPPSFEHVLQLLEMLFIYFMSMQALEVIELEQKAQLVHELDGNVMRCVRDQNGNHVIQKCIESIPTKKISFILSAFRGQVATLSMHPYGCRVMQVKLLHSLSS